jgi:hypothetical protein
MGNARQAHAGVRLLRQDKEADAVESSTRMSQRNEENLHPIRFPDPHTNIGLSYVVFSLQPRGVNDPLNHLVCARARAKCVQKRVL